MTRNKTDTIIGIVGAVAIALALVGVFVYEYNNVDDNGDNGGDGGDGDPPISSESFEGTVGQDESASEVLHPDAGVTTILISIEWTPTAPQALAAATAYSYELTAPDGSPIDSGSSSESTSINVAAPEDGEYTLTISVESPSQGGDYVVEATYDY